MNINQLQSLFDLWPYALLSIALIVALIAIGRMRRKSNRLAEELGKKVDRFFDLYSEESTKVTLLR